MRERKARKAACMVASLVVAVLACSCGGGDDGSPASTGTQTRSVSGWIGNASTGSGIPGAVVRIGSVSTTTNARGEFATGGVGVGDQSVRVTATNYVERQFTLSANQSTIDVRLQPASSSGSGIEPPPGTPAL